MFKFNGENRGEGRLFQTSRCFQLSVSFKHIHFNCFWGPIVMASALTDRIQQPANRCQKAVLLSNEKAPAKSRRLKARKSGKQPDPFGMGTNLD